MSKGVKHLGICILCQIDIIEIVKKSTKCELCNYTSTSHWKKIIKIFIIFYIYGNVKLHMLS